MNLRLTTSTRGLVQSLFIRRGNRSEVWEPYSFCLLRSPNLTILTRFDPFLLIAPLARPIQPRSRSVPCGLGMSIPFRSLEVI